MKTTASATPVSKSTSKSSGSGVAEFPNGDQPILTTWQRAPHIGTVFVVMNPKECENFEHLLKVGKKWRIAGKDWRILGVDRFMHPPPWTTREPIGLDCVPYDEKWNQ